MQLLEKIRPSTAAQTGPVNRLEFIDACKLPTQWANFTLHAFLEPATGKEHLVLTLGELSNGDSANDSPVLARVHSECLTVMHSSASVATVVRNLKKPCKTLLKKAVA